MTGTGGSVVYWLQRRTCDRDYVMISLTVTFKFIHQMPLHITVQKLLTVGYIAHLLKLMLIFVYMNG